MSMTHEHDFVIKIRSLKTDSPKLMDIKEMVPEELL